MILLADDDIVIQRILTQVLSRAGYTVDCANNGMEAMEKIRATHPQIVVTDLQMPLKDGLQLCREIRADKSLSDIRILVLSAVGADDVEEEVRKAGANEYAEKPVDPKRFLLLIQRLTADHVDP